MQTSIRLPSITGQTSAEQLAQIRSYIYQMVQDLNYALGAIEATAIGDTSKVAVKDETERQITPKEAETTFSSIKSLVIKSADIVNAYSKVIKEEFDGYYVAESDFGTYKNETQSEITKNSTNITAIYNNLSLLESTIKYIENTLVDTNAWIKQGLLEEKEDGTQIYGVEVGQKTERNGVEVFNKFARFTAGGLYFYQPGNDDAVAYLTDNILYITTAYILSLRLRDHLLDTTHGLALKYVGGK